MENPTTKLFIVIIPCYNESVRFDLEQYSKDLITFPELRIVFVNDGSTDNTLSVLSILSKKFNNQVEVVDLTLNVGKAAAVRAGVLYQLNKSIDFECIGYLDADLATSIEEWVDIAQFVGSKQRIDFAFGSRISKVGSQIDRKAYRHYIGRVIATFISNLLRLRVYDTQCGAKVFTKAIAELAFQKPFISKWLFDVEVFARILSPNNDFSQKNMFEYPLNRWIDKDGSKVKASYVFKLFVDLWRIKKSYPELKKRTMN